MKFSNYVAIQKGIFIIPIFFKEVKIKIRRNQLDYLLYCVSFKKKPQ